MNLPSACELCAPFGGAWMETDSGLSRCKCARGKSLADTERPKSPQAPVLNAETCASCAEMLAAIPNFYPREAAARSAIAEEIGAMCASPEDAVWLVKRMIRLYSKWPGVIEMRLVYCSGRQPLDGIQAICASQDYPDGIPSERDGAIPAALLAATETKRIAAGEVSSAASICETVEDLKRATDMRRALGPAPIIRPIPVTRVPSGSITQAMVDAAEREYRDKKARESIGVTA